MFDSRSWRMTIVSSRRRNRSSNFLRNDRCGLRSKPVDVEAPRRGAGMNVVRALIEKNEQNLAYTGASLVEMLGDAIECDLGGFVRGIAVDAGADGGKADSASAALLGQFQRFAIATGEMGRFAML